jgi:hypothetical protein
MSTDEQIRRQGSLCGFVGLVIERPGRVSSLFFV